MPSQPCHAITYLALITKVNETHTLQSHNQNDAKPLKDIDGILSLTSPSNRRVYTRSRDIRPKTPAIRSPVKIEPNTLDKPAYTHKPLSLYRQLLAAQCETEPGMPVLLSKWILNLSRIGSQGLVTWYDFAATGWSHRDFCLNGLEQWGGSWRYSGFIIIDVIWEDIFKKCGFLLMYL